ncbi:MAG: hypothetical protein K5921_01140 [Lachnospiraceae bacterium]|nr:hypothetical protein [Lachnospiraceae bacterium]
MSSPNKGGRPLKEEDNPRNKHLDIRVTEAEMKEIKEIAKSKDMKVTDAVIKGVRLLKDSTE